MGSLKQVVLLLCSFTLRYSEASRGFLLMGPKNVMKDSDERFCAFVEQVGGAATASLELLAVDADTVHAAKEFRLKGPNGCMELRIPGNITEGVARLRFRMRFDAHPDYVINSVKEIYLLEHEYIHVIQTDKPWYTPGQTVRFRLLSLNHLLQPIKTPIKKVWVEDPTGTAVSQWLYTETTEGLAQLEMPLSEEPVQGSWKIFMDRGGGKTWQEFEVREYVLPRFEVSLQTPGYVEVGLEKLSFNVCATYSFGQPVQGNWQVNLEVKEDFQGRYWFSRPEPATAPVKWEDRGQLKASTGCYTVKLSGRELGLSSEDSAGKTITVFASVTEQGTDISFNTTWTTRVERTRLTLDVKKHSPGVFKLGLPYYGKVLVTTANGVPVSNQSVNVCIKSTRSIDSEVAGPGKPTSTTRRSRIHRPSSQTTFEFCSSRFSDESGLAAFEFIPSDPKVADITVKATLVDKSTVQHQHTLASSYSKSQNFLIIAPPPNYPRPTQCGSKLPLKLYFTADGEMNLSVHYLVTSRGDVISWGVKHVAFKEEDNVEVPLTAEMKYERPSVKLNTETAEDEEEQPSANKLVGDLEIDLEVTPELSPLFSVLAYYVREDGEVVTATFDVPVQECFPNPVKLNWSSSRKQPGSQAKLLLKAASNSLCGYSVVDKSVTYMRPDLQMNERSILGKLPKFRIDPTARPLQTTPDWEYCMKTKGDDFFGEDGMELRRKRSIMPWYYSARHKDAMVAFDNAGLLVMSDYRLETRPCQRPSYLFRSRPISIGLQPLATEMMGPMLNSRTAIADAGDLLDSLDSSYDMDYSNVVDISSGVKVRTYFPETWLWDLVTLDDKGEASISAEVPHTITTWVGRALCLSESSGVGMSSTAQMEAFQPFFLELHLPYSAKRGEKMQIKVSVFNYLPESIPVRITLAYSEQLELVSESDSVQLCIPPKQSLVHNFAVRPAELGSVNVTVSAVIDEAYPQPCGPQFLPSGQDTIVKPLLVKPEGFPMERVSSHLVCPKDFEEDKVLQSDLSLPDDLVEGSARAWVTAIGDLMGPALQGLSGLVRMPMGCGEQNMILFTPNIYVIQYLEAVALLEPSVKNKAVSFMKSGYQRELTYRHVDGSYSAFGKSDKSGSLWLTSFVVKSFAAARKYIHIDDNDLKTSINWLTRQQLENGCFPVIGTVLHADLKGGLTHDDDSLGPLTAYTLISLLETREAGNFTIPDNLIANALLCISPDPSEKPDLYASSLAAYAFVLAGKVDEAREQLDWLMQRAQSNNSLLWLEKQGSGSSVSVEMTSYVLLTLVKLGTYNDLLKARSIVRWLSRMRNSEGGFVSTQDTIVALQAIAAYAAHIGAQPVNMELILTAGDLEQNLRLRDENRLVQQRVDLPLAPLAPLLKIEAVGEGEGCAVVQSTLRYNVHTAPENSAFSLSVKSTKHGPGSETCAAKRLDICARYLLPGKSNMALLEVSMVSGYSVVKSSLEDVLKQGVKRYEEKEDTVVFYFDDIDSSGRCISFTVWPAFEVNDAKEAVVRIFDYYQTEKTISTSYLLSAGCALQQLPPSQPIDDTPALPPLPELPEPESEVVAVGELRAVDIAVVVEPIVSNRRSAKQYANQDFSDLDVPDGVEGPVPVIARPDQRPGCPVCLDKPPSDFNELFCRASKVYRADTRGDGRLKITSDVSADKQQPSKVGTFVTVVLSGDCKCTQLMQGNQTVIILGLGDLPTIKPPVRMLIGPEVTAITLGQKNFVRAARLRCAAKNP